MKRTYEVSVSLHNHDKGAKVTQDDLPGLNVAALVQGGFLKPTGYEDEPCPACVEAGMKRPPKFSKPDELRDHYAEKHAGLEPPREEE